MFVSMMGNVDMVKLLLQCNADTCTRNAAGNTALHIAALHGCIDVVRTLLTHSGGVDVEAEAANGQTATHAASWLGFEDVVLLLLEHGADPNHASDAGKKWTPVYTAASNG